MSEFQSAVPFDSLKPGEIVQRVMSGRALAFYVVEGAPYCTEDMCSHEECFISEGGFVEGEEVECSCHGARFSVKTGEVTALPATEPIRTFPVELRDGQVFVSL